MPKARNKSSDRTKLLAFGFYPSAKKRWVWLIIFSVLSLSMKDNLEFVHALLHQIPNGLHNHVADQDHDLMDHADGEHGDEDPFHKMEKDSFKSVFKAHLSTEKPSIQQFVFSTALRFLSKQEALPHSRGIPVAFSPPDQMV